MSTCAYADLIVDVSVCMNNCSFDISSGLSHLTKFLTTPFHTNFLQFFLIRKNKKERERERERGKKEREEGGVLLHLNVDTIDLDKLAA